MIITDIWIPKLREGTVLTKGDASDCIIVYSTNGHSYFRLKNEFMKVIEQIDGVQDSLSIANVVPEIDLVRLDRLLTALANSGIIEFPLTHEPESKRISRFRGNSFTRYFRKHISIDRGILIWTILNLGEYREFLTKLVTVGARLKLKYPYFSMVLLMPIFFLSNLSRFKAYARGPLSAGDLTCIFFGFLICSLLHELAHLYSLVLYGGKPAGFGFMSVYGNPAIFCDISSSWSMGKRKRLLIALSGVSMNFFLGTFFMSLWYWCGHGRLAKSILLLALINVIVGFLNLYPFVKLDGYLALLALTDISNLREKSILMLREKVRQSIIGKNVQDKSNPWIVIYGAIAFISPFILMVIALTAVNVQKGHLVLFHHSKFATYFILLILLSLVLRIFRMLVRTVRSR